MIREYISKILEEIGENPAREELKKTPERVETSILQLTSGYRESLEEIIKDAVFHSAHPEMIVVKDLDFVSLCEHHLLPFFGKVHIAYIPDSKIIGLSKVSRIVDMFAKRLQIQERLTEEISQCIENVIKAKGVVVLIEAVHLCMVIRGVEKKDSKVFTSSMRGIFSSDSKIRKEFYNLIRKKRKK